MGACSPLSSIRGLFCRNPHLFTWRGLNVAGLSHLIFRATFPCVGRKTRHWTERFQSAGKPRKRSVRPQGSLKAVDYFLFGENGVLGITLALGGWRATRTKLPPRGLDGIPPSTPLVRPLSRSNRNALPCRYIAILGNVEHDNIHTPNRQADAASLDELAASQGVVPVTDFDSLLGHPSSEDESVDEFSAMLREWRCEGTAPARRQ